MIIRGQTTNYVENSGLININQKVNKGRYLEMQYCKFLNPAIDISPEKFARKGDVLLNSLGQGTLGRVHYWNIQSSNYVIDQHITIIRAKENVTTPIYLYMLLSSNEFYNNFLSSVTGSTGMQMLNISAVRSTKIPNIPYDAQKDISIILNPLFEQIEINRIENEKLADIRNALLPRLMNGDIAVSNITV